jgi:hypothetical protein
MPTAADIILARLGGAAFQIRTGARNPKPIPGGLTLDLPIARTKRRADQVRITVIDDDTHCLETIKRNGRAFRWVEIADCVPADELPERFANLTGLDV